jgi:hypothetical protein
MGYADGRRMGAVASLYRVQVVRRAFKTEQRLMAQLVTEGVERARNNRFSYVDREHIEGSLGGVDFGYNISCIARSPIAALLWSAGSAYWSGIAFRAYAASHLIGFKRSVDFSRAMSGYKRYGENGGRLTAARIEALHDPLTALFEEDISEPLIEAVRRRMTLVIEDGGEAFRPQYRRR